LDPRRNPYLQTNSNFTIQDRLGFPTLFTMFACLVIIMWEVLKVLELNAVNLGMEHTTAKAANLI